MGLVKMYVHRLWVLSRRSSDELGHCLPIGGLHKLIDDNVGFELGLNLVDVLDRDTGKVVYGYVRVLCVECHHRRF